MNMQETIRKGEVFLVLLSLFAVGPQLFAAQQDQNKPADLFEMPLEELKNVEIASSATLTDVQPRLVPAAVTVITEEQIQVSGARSLFELLEIYVPNLQWVHNSWEPDNMGLRGIMTDHDDKYLLLVNGRIMNERTHYGAVTERDMVLLKDIHHIDVVRGPGSALYGPGAVSMVINIVTHDAKTFEGTDITTRAGAVEEFYTTEIRHGRKFKDGDGGIFAYAGIGEYRGANQSDAPFIVPGDATGPLGTYQEGEHMRKPSINDGEAYRDLPPLKFYGELTRGTWDMWVRYTRGGKQFLWDKNMLFYNPYGWGNQLPYEDSGYGYQQLTAYLGKLTQLGPQTTLDTSFSYSLLDYQRVTDAWTRWFNEAHREDTYLGRAIIKHNFNENHKIAFGFEVLHGEYGYKPIGWPGGRAIADAFPNTANGIPYMPRWSTNLYSVLGEYQWTINDQWTAFVGARIDDHSYTERMFSPRAALVFTPNDKDTWKLMWSRSVRANTEEQLKLANASDSPPEKLDNLELRYERKQNKNLDLAASVFVHYNLQLIGFNGAVGQTTPVATQRDWGFELEAAYHTEKTRIAISHGFTKLYAFNVPQGQWSNVSAMGYGYGDDLALWSNHITKITAQHKLNDKWELDGSMRIYWGFPGMKDFNRYTHAQFVAGTGWPDTLADADWQRSYRAAPYLNLGLQYKPNKNLTFRVDGYYLLGMFNKDFNKRVYGGNNPTYHCSAPAVGFSMIYKF
ncbi:MAG: TonB-dependent receptor [Sedimentisphaerales bacterium]